MKKILIIILISLFSCQVGFCATYTPINQTATTAVAANRYTAGLPTYDNTRYYFPFDLSSLSGTVLSATVTVNGTAVTGAFDYALRSDNGSSNPGAALDGTQADFESTNTYLEETKTVSSTGLIVFTVTPAHINIGGTQWFRLATTNENQTTNANLTINTAEASSNKPTLTLSLLKTSQSNSCNVTYVNITSDFNGTTLDGNIRGSEAGSPLVADIP